jgi:DhnA family fructose-bisphosphate aldolase class Ia
VAIGRRVWGSKDPAATFRAIKAIVMDGATAAEAIALFKKGKKN